MYSLKLLTVVLYSTIWYNKPNVNQYVYNTDITFIPNGDTFTNEVFLTISHNMKHSKIQPRKQSNYHLINLLLILSGQIETNPGPARAIKFPCGECYKAVKWGQRAIACDSCDKWFHKECIEMNSIIYHAYESTADLSWECCHCGIKNISSSLFDNTFNSSTDSNLSNVSAEIPKLLAKQLRILCINFRSIWDKKELLEEALFENNIDVILGSETHLDPSIKEKEFLPEAYKCFRCDRTKNNSKGGAIIIVKKELITEQVKKSELCELVSVKIQTHKHPVIIAACYRPPDSNLLIATNICNEIKALRNTFKNSPIWFGGDINLPDIDWNNNAIVSHHYKKNINEIFLETFDDCGLEQLVKFPTREENTLDIVATNRPTFVNRCVPHPGVSDHQTAVLLDIVCHPIRSKPNKRKILLWNRANIISIKDQLSTEIAEFIATHDIESPVNDIWGAFKTLIDNAMLSVPSKYTSSRYSQPWITQKCKRLSRRKKRAYNRAKKSSKPADWERFKKLTIDCRKACKSAFNNFVRNCVSPDGVNNPKKLFRFIKSRSCENDGVAPLRENGTLHIDDTKKANILNKQFSSVFSVPNGQIPPLQGQPNIPMSDITITEAGVRKLLNDVNPNKAAGPDGIPSRFLKEFSEQISPGLTLVMQASLKQSTIPDDWRHALVAPVFKPGKNDKSKASNYRPISLTSISCKIMEHIIHSNIMSHFDNTQILTDTQHGFRKHRSCESQLTTTIQDLAKSLNEAKQVDTILLDFSKAFDKVDHNKLCLKLYHYGVRGNTLEWIKDYLSKRSQTVVINGANSEKSPVISGVPQGTVLGPLLFLVYINDLPVLVTCKIRLFADDALIYRVIDSINDAILLQEDLNQLIKWESDWSMEFNADKCKVLRITNKRIIINQPYAMHGQILEVVDSAKYLGVYIHKKLSWNTHIDYTVKKANQTRCFIQRNLRSCHPNTKLQCYKTYVRPILEYGSIVWDPHSAANIHKLEMVQRKAARFITNDWRQMSSPTMMLRNLDLKTLQTRRKVNKVKFMHKILHGPVESLSDLAPRARNTHLRLIPINARIQSYEFSYFPSTIRLWNALPVNVVSELNYDSFCKSISDHYP